MSMCVRPRDRRTVRVARSRPQLLPPPSFWRDAELLFVREELCRVNRVFIMGAGIETRYWRVSQLDSRLISRSGIIVEHETI